MGVSRPSNSECAKDGRCVVGAEARRRQVSLVGAFVVLAAVQLAGARIQPQRSSPNRALSQGCGPTGEGLREQRLVDEPRPTQRQVLPWEGPLQGERHRSLVLSISTSWTEEREVPQLCLWSDGLVALREPSPSRSNLARLARLEPTELDRLLAAIELSPTSIVAYPVTRVWLRRGDVVTMQFFAGWFPTWELRPNEVPTEPPWFRWLVAHLSPATTLEDDLATFAARCISVPDGPSTRRFDDGGAFEHGLRTGHWILTWASGIVRAEGDFVEERRVGLWREFTSDGRLRIEAEYEGGQLHGTSTLFTPAGGVFNQTFVHGTLNGPTLNLRHGRLLEYGVYVDGKKQGAWLCFDGSASACSDYRAGWFEDGVRCSD